MKKPHDILLLCVLNLYDSKCMLQFSLLSVMKLRDTTSTCVYNASTLKTNTVLSC